MDTHSLIIYYIAYKNGVAGRFLDGRYVAGRFVLAPLKHLHVGILCVLLPGKNVF